MRMGQWRTNSILRGKIDRNREYIWFHAASLGEFEQGRPMIEAVKARYPYYKILLTFFSPSGFEVRKNYSLADVVCYLPFDLPHKVHRFLDLARPAIAIFIKYEFWWNYLKELHRRHIPTYCISAVFRRNQWFFRWYGRPYLNALRCFDKLFLQDQCSADLLEEHRITSVSVTGDTRFDRVMDTKQMAPPIEIVERFVNASTDSKLVLIAGSSWPQDEELFIRFFNDNQGIKLIIAPHEINRNRLLYIHSLLKRPSICMSEAGRDSIVHKDCLIVDSFGLLSSIYRYGNIAYLGGGFGKGIHNLLEAAVYAIPVIFGPNYHKHREAKDLIGCNGGFSVSNSESFNACMHRLISDPDSLASSSRAAGQFVSINTGATERILSQIPLSPLCGSSNEH
jgi:3-deoxy-D-manno-octulosonic-acid transferase